METLRERLIQFLDEVNNSIQKNNSPGSWYSERGRGMLDVALDLKRILDEYPEMKNEST